MCEKGKEGVMQPRAPEIPRGRRGFVHRFRPDLQGESCGKDGQTSQAKRKLKEVVQRSLDALGH
eukprot:symbB.v1.2.041333.t1/scaffold8071.1/size7891/1